MRYLLFTLSLALAILLCPSVMFAAETEVSKGLLPNGCMAYTICSANASPQVCGGSGNERYVDLSGLTRHIFTATWTGSADAWTVGVYNAARGEGYSTQRGLINTSAYITSSNPSYVFNGALEDVHAERFVGTSDTVTLTGVSCP